MRKLILIILIIGSSAFAQDSPVVQMVQRYADSLSVSLNKIDSLRSELAMTPTKLYWDQDTTGSISEYMVFYIQGIDTTDFSDYNFVTGADYTDIWEWWIGSSLYDFFYVKVKDDLYPGTSYVRLGIVGLRYDSTTTPLVCIQRCLVINKSKRIKEIKIGWNYSTITDTVRIALYFNEPTRKNKECKN